MHKNLINGILVGAVALVLVVFAGLVRVTARGDTVAVLQGTAPSLGASAARVIKALKGTRGVLLTETDPLRGRIFACYDATQATAQEIAAAAGAAGFIGTLQGVLSPGEFRALSGHDLKPRVTCCGLSGCRNPNDKD